VVGSAIIRRIAEHVTEPEVFTREIVDLLQSMREAMDAEQRKAS